ncbi:hypothetical protein, partial [Salmonella sp. s51228]|uniref:hypothetical protein n=1 Tax=Salmonella sp. s51228 TaxID=3159652 RepID=UPI00398039FE
MPSAPIIQMPMIPPMQMPMPQLPSIPSEEFQAYPSNLTYNPPAYPDTSITKPPQNNEDYSLLGEDTPGHNDATPSAPDFVLPSVPTNNNNNDGDDDDGG